LGRVELLDAILANSADHLFVFDRGARCTYASRAGAGALGRTPAEMMGKTLGEVEFASEVAEPIEQQIRAVYLTGGSVAGEARVKAPGGVRNFEYVLTPVFGSTGRVEAVVATVHDITGHKVIEHDLKEAKTLAERAGVMKDQFLAALSHELRTPLTPVLATVSALASDGSLPEHVRSAVSMIRRNVELQTRLIDDLLDLTRVAKGKIELKLGAVDLLAAVRDAADMCRGDADAKGMRIELPAEPASSPAYVRGDEARVRQVLWNLIKNAVKFTGPDGEVVITIQPPQDERVTLEIRDTGIGIAAHLIERIFLPFEQGEPIMARRFGGLGLGLAISKGLVELHGGELSARSAGIGRGSTFTLTLPATTAPREPEGAPEATSIKATATDVSSPSVATTTMTLRVLIVDDHEDTRHVIRRLLAGPGLDIRTAGCVSEALEEAALYDFDLLISDIGLPDGSGLDLMKQLRSRYGMNGIALSGYGTEDDVRRSRAAGFHSHLTKPITSEALRAAVGAVAREEADLPPDPE
ncbi:MAG: ATP-binding protein, partial [Tepidisphaeraceae bacterium]